MKRGTCGTCAFWHDVNKECRFNPPTVEFTRHPNFNAMHITSFWPTVDANDWCGRYHSAIVRGVRKTINHQINDGDIS